jgi:hypothetical protein
MWERCQWKRIRIYGLKWNVVAVREYWAFESTKRSNEDRIGQNAIPQISEVPNHLNRSEKSHAFSYLCGSGWKICTIKYLDSCGAMKPGV